MPYDPRFVFRQSLTGSRALLDFGGTRFSFAFRLVEDWFHASASRRRRAGFCATHKRSRALPGVPTLDEEGMADFDTSLWFGLLGPPGTPRPIINKLADAAPKAMQTPKAQEALRKQGFEPVNGGPDEFAEYIRRENARWSDVAQAAGLRS